MPDPWEAVDGRANWEAPPSTFLSLLQTHAQLDELFLLHQEALLAFDIPLAIERLHEFEHRLLIHMCQEEDLLLPVYQRAGSIPGGTIILFTGEHQKMRELRGRFQEILGRLASEPPGLRREIIRLLDYQTMFKHLVEHHNLRERNILYPTLDKVTGEEERRELLGQCLTELEHQTAAPCRRI
ncbi:MAG: hemerythrin domain-containing protein [Armatimonadetes bacterium]|nr:hemerythrin domain-containing protein [Armatimonadota bacterium]